MSTRASFASLPIIASAALLLCLCAAPAATAAARECGGVSFPGHLQAHGATLTLNGLGLRKATIFGIKVYVGALYVGHPTSDAAAVLSSSDPAEIELRFVFHVTAGQLRDAWREGFEKSARGQLAQLQSRIAQLDGWMTSVSSGQRMTFLRIPGVGVQYSLDGAVKGTIPGDDFARAFFAIWLGSSPPSPELRAGLLGGPCT
ncbi:MAG: chalcone isomerase family protein [Gammaproteobacteria bacterium]|nr:chalcone isomerase family protein [Gammaproteobacteria bacterium]MDE2264111.1 chalcone isomerase family protein [Gammaproteobacteria bacterium]